MRSRSVLGLHKNWKWSRMTFKPSCELSFWNIKSWSIWPAILLFIDMSILKVLIINKLLTRDWVFEGGPPTKKDL